MPTSRLRRKNNLVFWVFFGIILLIVYFIIYSYFTNISQSKERVLNKLSAVVNTSASFIDGDLHACLSSSHLSKDDIKNNQQDSNYFNLHTLLKQVHFQNKLESPVYTMVYDTAKTNFEFIGSSSVYPYYRHTYKKFPKILLELYETGGVLDVHESENGTWLSAFAPIKNSIGETIALLQADENFEQFILQARIQLLKNITLTLLLILPFAFLLYSYLRSTLDKEEKNQTLLLEKNEQIASQNAFIKENNKSIQAVNLLIEQKNEQLNEKVLERTRKLSVSNKELRTFLYRSSHDIQGPLTTLRGLCNLANKDITDPEALAYIYMINDSTNKLYHTIKSINNVYEIKHKRIKLENIKLISILDQISETLHGDMKNKGICMDVKVNEDIAIQADRDILRLVLTELVKNSIQFNSKLNSENPYIKVLARQANNTVEVEIEDNGIGISDEIHQLIFEMFQKGNENSDGPGLGLYAAKIGMRKLNGTIVLGEKNSNITSFRLRLPAA